MKEPARLFSEGGSLAQALGELRQRTPDADRLERMAQNLSEFGVDVKLESPQGLDAPKSGIEAVPAKAASSAAAKIAASVGGVVALGLALALLGRGTPTPTAPSEADSRAAAPVPSSEARVPGVAHPSTARPSVAHPSVAVPGSTPAAPALEAAAPPVEGAAVGEQQPAPAANPRPGDSEPGVLDKPRAASARSASGTPPSPEPNANAEEPALATREPEIALLKRAREALARNPGTALALAEQHRELYPAGRLGQEREVIAVTALVRMGLPTSAQQRAEQFKRAYPRSAYIGQLERIIGAD